MYDGTLPTQETLIGTIAELTAAAAQSATGDRRFSSSGAWSALREHLRWFDARPLFGKRILVTRPREQAAELVERLEMMGAQAIEAPMIRIAPPDDFGPLDEACARAQSYDWIVFSSANAVDAFLERLLTAHDIRALAGVKLAVVGPAAAERLARVGLRVELTPSSTARKASCARSSSAAPSAG